MNPSSEPDLDPQPQINPQNFPNQVCIVFICPQRDDFQTTRSCDYDIVVADVDSLRNKARNSDDDDDNEFIPVRAAIRLTSKSPDSFLSFCGLGSKLYIFESAPHKSAYSIDLSPYYSNSNDLTNPTLVLDHNDLRNSNNNKIRDMRHPKEHPCAIPTPDSKKILFFSTGISDPRTRQRANEFELYDIKTDTWRKLPGIRPDLCTISTSISAFTFVGTSTFVIDTSCRLMFALNLECIDQGWQRMGTLYSDRSSFYPGRFYVLEEHLCVYPGAVKDIQNQKPFECAFQLPSLGGVSSFGTPFVHLLGDQDGKHNFGNLFSGLSLSSERSYPLPYTYIPRLILNFTSCDLSRYKRNKDGSDQDKEELSKCMTVNDSIKFCLDTEQHTACRAYCFFSIRP